MRTLLVSIVVLVGCSGSAIVTPDGGAAGTDGDGAAEPGIDAPDVAADHADASPVEDAADGNVADAGETSCALRVVEMSVIDVGGDGFFDTAEGGTVRVVVENGGGAQGPVVVRVTSDDPRVNAANATASRIPGIAGGARETLEVPLVIPAQVWFGSEFGLTATATLADDPTCVTPPVAPLVVTMGTRPEQLEVCDATRQLVLSNPRVVGAGADERIEPGADVLVAMTVANPGPLDHSWYPTFFLASDNPGVTEVINGGHYALSAGQTVIMTSRLHVDAEVPHGALVHLTATAGALQVRCRNLRPLEVLLPVE